MGLGGRANLPPFLKWLEKARLVGLEPTLNKWYGVYPGIVEDANDPERSLRLRVRVKAIHGEEAPNYWSYPKGVYTGPNAGFIAVPKPGSMVWVEFQAGNPEYPVWSYATFKRGDSPAGSDYPNQYLLQTPEGHFLELNDTAGTVSLQHKNGNLVRITGDAVVLEHTGGQKVTVDSGGVHLGTQAPNIDNPVLFTPLISALDAMITALTTPANILAPPPAGVGAFNPATLAALQSVRASLQQVGSTTVTLGK